MGLLLVRHGEAVQGGPDGDLVRYLSPRGRAATLALGLAAKAQGLTAHAIITSPLVRAVQTAEILAHALGYTGVITTDAGIVPEGDPIAFARRAPTGAPLTIVVCHEPIIRGIAAALLVQPAHPGFETSGAVLFSDGPGKRTPLARF